MSASVVGGILGAGQEVGDTVAERGMHEGPWRSSPGRGRRRCSRCRSRPGRWASPRTRRSATPRCRCSPRPSRGLDSLPSRPGTRRVGHVVSTCSVANTTPSHHNVEAGRLPATAAGAEAIFTLPTTWLSPSSSMAPAAARPQVERSRSCLLLELLLDVGRIRDQVLGVHVRGEPLHHLERREGPISLSMVGRFGAVDERAAHARGCMFTNSWAMFQPVL